MRNTFFLLILLAFPFNLFSQVLISNYSVKDFDFVGFIDNKPIFRYVYNYHKIGDTMPIEKAVQWGLYTIKSNKYINFHLYEKPDLDLGRTLFVNDDKRIYWDYKNKNKLKVITNDISYNIILKDNLINLPIFSSINNIIIYSTRIEKYLNLIEFKNDVLISKLPILGINNYILNGYLYFDYHHISKSRATPSPVDLYRVKIGDWNNPELLTEFISDSWLPLNDSIVLMTLPIKGKGKQVFYNINNKTYVETETKLPTTYIKYEGKDYLLGVKRDEYGINKYALQPYPDIPEYGYKKDNQREILPRVLDVNLPNKDKQFSGTFITDELLYNATKEELKKLSSEKLRILRNAFFARQGYDFNSDDLKKFFGQFEWYNQLLESNEFFEISNEDVVISPKDKERVELILEIESSK